MRVIGVILAAGEGRRLGGVAKAGLLTAAGRTFIESVATTMREAGVDEVVTVVAEPHAEESTSAARRAGVDRVVRNPLPERGMLSSLVTGLSLFSVRQVDAVLSWPVDHPDVGVEVVRSLVRVAARDRAVVPRYQGRGGHPVLFGADLWTELEDAIDAPDGARSVLRSDPSRIVQVDVSDAAVRRDVDHPEDLPSG